MKKELLNNDACPEQWDQMRTAPNGRFCEKCSTSLTDLADKTIEEIAKNHYGKGKCVAVTDDQLDFIINLKRIKQISIAAGLFLGTVFFNQSYAQVQKNDSCLIKGVIVDSKKDAVANRTVLIYINESDSVFETKTDAQGKFQIYLPKECEIKHSNIKGLISKKTENKNVLNIGKIKLPPPRLTPGFL